MTNPCPGYSITTPWGKKGSAWSCGMHDGADYAAPAGTDVVAMWGGTVVEADYPTTFGSAFGRAVVIDHDKLPDGSPGYWAIYAHLSAENVTVGQRVTAGQKIGDVGTTGNSTGNHLHVGVYEQPYWKSCAGINPQPWIDAGAIDHGQVLLSKLVYGQRDSDSVRRLQLHLNAHPLDGGQSLPISGNYLDETDEEVRLDQTQHGFGNDPAGQSSVGPQQAAHLISGCACTIVDDRVPAPQPPDPEPEPPVLVSGYNVFRWYSKKRTDEITVKPGQWVLVDLPAMPPSGKSGKEEHFLYLRILLPKGRTATRTIETYWERSDGDETAYWGPSWDAGAKDSIPYYNFHTEDGTGLGGRWWIKVTGGSDPIKYSTRYAKTTVEYSDPIETVAAFTVSTAQAGARLVEKLAAWAARKAA